MAIIAQALFGSHARGDFHSNSDIDLLSIIDRGDFPSSSSFGTLNVSYYSAEHLLNDARLGHLFVMHIVREALPIFDPSHFHKKLCDQFRIRKNYNDDIKRASDLGWLILRQGDLIVDDAVYNKRLSWCARTISIAHSVNSGLPLFSPGALVNFIHFEHLQELLSAKLAMRRRNDLSKFLEMFLDSYGHPEPTVVMDGSFPDQWKYFRDTNNNFALKTLALRRNGLAEVGYV